MCVYLVVSENYLVYILIQEGADEIDGLLYAACSVAGMYEVELKVETAHESVRERLRSHGANRVETVTQQDTYYDAPDRSFANTDEALRIRSEIRGDETVTMLTYKGPLVDADSKTRTEAETTVEDGTSMADILTGLGYEPAATVRKEREYFTLDDCTITLDAVEGLGEFVEVEYGIEVESKTQHSDSQLVESESDIEAARERAEDVMGQLGLDSSEQIRTSYLELLLENE